MVYMGKEVVSRVDEYFKQKNKKPKIQVAQVKYVEIFNPPQEEIIEEAKVEIIEETKVEIIEEVKVDPVYEQQQAMIQDLWADCKLNTFGVLPSSVPTDQTLISAPEVPQNIELLSREEQSQYQLA